MVMVIIYNRINIKIVISILINSSSNNLWTIIIITITIISTKITTTTINNNTNSPNSSKKIRESLLKGCLGCFLKGLAKLSNRFPNR